MTTVRVTISNETNSGGRRGWSKVVSSIDTTKTNGYAFLGSFINDGVETDLEVGSVVIQQHPEGSVKHDWNSGHCYVIGSDGQLHSTHSDTYRWDKQFLSFRDHVAEVMADPLSYLPDDGSSVEGTTDPLAEVKAELKRQMNYYGITTAMLS